MDLSVIIPARNEARRIEATLAAYAREFATDAEIIVVVNGSTDATFDVVSAMARSLPHVVVLDIPERIGKGGAVRAGLAIARGTWVGFVDADMATAPEEYRRILDAARTADAAIGSRWTPGAHVLGRTLPRAIVGGIFLALVRVLFDLRFADTQCGAKIFHRRFLPGYLAASHVNDLAFDVEMLLLLQRAGARIVEVPTVWVSQPGSAALGTPAGVIRHGLFMVRSLLRLRFGARKSAPLPRAAAAPGPVERPR